MRWLLTIVLLFSTATLAADGDAAPYTGRSVAAVIDEFREAGHPFAYSTNLVAATLTVREEPEATDPVEIVREILRPHDLTIRSEAGVHLVVRYDREGLPGESVVLVVTSKGSDQPIDRKSVV